MTQPAGAHGKWCSWRILGADPRRDRRPALALARYFCNRCLEEPGATARLLLLVVRTGTVNRFDQSLANCRIGWEQ
jgi:hypothetical protein